MNLFYVLPCLRRNSSKGNLGGKGLDAKIKMSEAVITCEFKKGRADLRNSVRISSLWVCSFPLVTCELVTRAVKSAS